MITINMDAKKIGNGSYSLLHNFHVEVIELVGVYSRNLLALLNHAWIPSYILETCDKIHFVGVHHATNVLMALSHIKNG